MTDEQRIAHIERERILYGMAVEYLATRDGAAYRDCIGLVAEVFAKSESEIDAAVKDERARP